MVRRTAETRAAIEQSCWATALRLGEFGYAEISAEKQIGMDTATEIVRGWQKAGRCELIQDKHGMRKLFRVVDAKQLQTARRGSVPQNIWTAMRGLKSFSPTDLAAHATTDAVEVTPEVARSYCQALLTAKYLKVERKAAPGRREAIYRLVRDTGPRPPRQRRVRAVWDDNLGEFTHVAGGAK